MIFKGEEAIEKKLLNLSKGDELSIVVSKNRVPNAFLIIIA
jgi:hypothetical protein